MRVGSGERQQTVGSAAVCRQIQRRRQTQIATLTAPAARSRACVRLRKLCCGVKRYKAEVKRVVTNNEIVHEKVKMRRWQ